VTPADAPSSTPAGAWVAALPLEQLWEGEMVGLRLKHAEVLLINLGPEGIRAYDNHCPHAGSLLSEGQLRRGLLVCASHLWEFDVRTGEGVNPRSCQIRKLPVQVIDGTVMVQLSDAAGPP
jgi:toluene monooxygenase system ferredoxin subunit